MATHNTAKFKEKIVVVYEAVFSKGDLKQTILKTDTWADIFLLRVNSVFLENCISMVPEDELLAMEANLNLFCHAAMKHIDDENQARRCNALQVRFFF